MALTLSTGGQGGIFTLRGGSFGGRFRASVTPPPPSLLLDVYSDAAAAYSLRKLRTAYTGAAIRVRRSSDNTETDIGFVNNQLDTVALTTFVGSGNGFVTTWYDQSGNSNNAVQVLSNLQPKIVVSGGLITQGIKPTIFFDNTSPNNLTLTTGISSNSNLSVFFTQKSNSASTYGSLLGHASPGGSGPAFGIYNDNKFLISIQINGVSKLAVNDGSTIGTLFNILNIVVDNSNFNTYVNNTYYPLTASSWTPSATIFTRIGSYFNFYSNSNISELLIYKTDQTSNRSAIVSNINSYYSIY
jgi:hypothetical protein